MKRARIAGSGAILLTMLPRDVPIMADGRATATKL